MKAVGNLALLRVSYQLAANLRNWELTRDDSVSLNNPPATVTAKVDSINSFWATQTPLTLGLWMGEVWWIWRVLALEPGLIKGAKVKFLVDSDFTIQPTF